MITHRSMIRDYTLTFKLFPNSARQHLARPLFKPFCKNVSNIRTYTKEVACAQTEESLDLSSIHSCLDSVENIYLNPDHSREILKNDLNNKSGVYL